jgi:hypothetical protein
LPARQRAPPVQQDVMAYAVDQGWIAVAPNGQSVRVNEKGHRLIAK